MASAARGKALIFPIWSKMVESSVRQGRENLASEAREQGLEELSQIDIDEQRHKDRGCRDNVESKVVSGVCGHDGI